jgi:hypothetical protein
MRVNKSLTVIEALGRLVSFLPERGVKPVEPASTLPGCAAHLVSAASMRKAPRNFVIHVRILPSQKDQWSVFLKIAGLSTLSTIETNQLEQLSP